MENRGQGFDVLPWLSHFLRASMDKIVFPFVWHPFPRSFLRGPSLRTQPPLLPSSVPPQVHPHPAKKGVWIPGLVPGISSPFLSYRTGTESIRVVFHVAGFAREGIDRHCNSFTCESDASDRSMDAGGWKDGKEQAVDAWDALDEEASKEDKDDGNASREVQIYLYKKLQETYPGTKVTKKSLGMLENLLDVVVRNIVDEAEQLVGVQGKVLSTTEVLRATRKVLPGAPGQALRPYLPGVCKKARHLDKESLKRKHHGGKATEDGKQKAPKRST